MVELVLVVVFVVVVVVTVVVVIEVIVVGITRSGVKISSETIATSGWEANRTPGIGQVISPITIIVYLIFKIVIEVIVNQQVRIIIMGIAGGAR